MKKSVYVWIGVFMSFVFIFVNHSALAALIAGAGAQITNLYIDGYDDIDCNLWEFKSYAEAQNEKEYSEQGGALKTVSQPLPMSTLETKRPHLRSLLKMRCAHFRKDWQVPSGGGYAYSRIYASLQ